MRVRSIVFSVCAMMVAIGCEQASVPDTAPALNAPVPLENGSEPWRNKDICEDSPNKASTDNVAKVFFGTQRPRHVPLGERQVMAVVGLGSSSRGSTCSGTLIAPRVVLTAKHCTEGRSTFYAMFGENSRSPLLSVRVRTKREHPSLDMAMLELESTPGDTIAVDPILIDTDHLANADIGLTLEQSGYGRTETGSSNNRLFVAERFDGFSNRNQNLVVNGQGLRGVCFGDSGGPSMRLSERGDTRVVGVLSNGDGSCVDRDNYARVELARVWIEEWTGTTPEAPVEPEEEEEETNPCQQITSEGACGDDGQSAVWCDDVRVVSETCSGAQVCGWSDAVSGWRCITPESDPCDGIGFRGRCADDGTLEFCQDGTLLSRPCGECGEQCVLIDESFGFACVAHEIMPDSDSDGIPDDLDLCSNTPIGATPWPSGAWMGCAGGQFLDSTRPPPQPEPEPEPLDSDRDGVPNSQDRCSNTPLGAPVWRSGDWTGCAGGQFRDR